MGTYVLQMGHVPRTRGSTGAPGEQGYNQAVCNEAKRLLLEQGHAVHVIPADPAFYPRGDVFVAVHYDGSDNPRARGASVGYRDAAGQRWALRWKEAYQRLGWFGGFRQDNYTAGLRGYYGTGRSNCDASFILEGGFGSHPTEGPFLRSPRGIAMCAQAIVLALTGGIAGPVIPPPEQEQEEDDSMKFNEGKDKPSARVIAYQHALTLFINQTGGWGDWGEPIKKDGHLGPKTAEAGQHAEWRLEIIYERRSFYLDPANPSEMFCAYLGAANIDLLDKAKAKRAREAVAKAEAEKS